MTRVVRAVLVVGASLSQEQVLHIAHGPWLNVVVRELIGSSVGIGARLRRPLVSIEFNHTLVHAKDIWAAAREVGGVLGLAEPSSYGPFAVLQFDNGTTLDFIEDTGDIKAQHYAFLVGEDDFDAIWDRLKEQGRQWWADPHRRHPGEINHEDGGRGLYWQGPDGHWLEIITRPYGSGT
jgi:catechol 2,3-dioxygenase-like lactoylglutathione lyase family enzyme